MQLLEFVLREREYFFRNASWTGLSEDLANMLKKKKNSVLNQKARHHCRELQFSKEEFKEPAFKQKGNARVIYLRAGNTSQVSIKTV